MNDWERRCANIRPILLHGPDGYSLGFAFFEHGEAIPYDGVLLTRDQAYQLIVDMTELVRRAEGEGS